MKDLHVACAARKPVIRVPILYFFLGEKTHLLSPLFHLHLTHVFEPSFVIVDVEM